jgi:signal transduction histidine kinase
MRRRILLSIVAVTVIAVVGFFVPAAAAIRTSIRRGDSLDVERDAAIVASRVPQSPTIDVAALQRLVGDNRQIAVYDETGYVDGVGPAGPDALVRTALDGEFAEGWSDGNLIAAVPVRASATQPSTVVRIEEPAGVSRRRIERSVTILAMIGAAIIGVATLVGILLSRRLVRPIDQLTAWAAHTDSAASAPDATGIEELDELRTALVESRRRVDEALERERSFSSHVSHQLRTPVTALRTAIETELTAPRPDPTSLLHEGLGAVDRLESTITSLLAFARRRDARPELGDATLLTNEHVDHWRPTLAAHGRDIRVTGWPVIVRVDPVMLRHILDVLIENALVHGRGRIDVRVASGHGHAGQPALIVDVADEGTLPDGADPFTDRRADTRGGIGLRLARTLAEAGHGRLRLSCSSPTTFSLLLSERIDVDAALTSS